MPSIPPVEYYTSAFSGPEMDARFSMLGNTPQQALANLGAGVRPNLLDNAYFVGGGSQQGGGQLPVNQRGQTSYSGAGYGIDRWFYGTISLVPQGIKLAAETTLYQRLGNPARFADTVLTYSVLWSDGRLLTVTGDPAQSQAATDNNRAISFAVDSAISALWVAIQSLDATEKTAVAAKLEFGDTQTLAYQDDDGNWQLLPQSDMDYGIQLTRCQQRLLILENQTIPVTVFSNSITGVIPTPVSMDNSAAPTVTFSGSAFLYTPSGPISTNLESYIGLGVQGNGVLFAGTADVASNVPAVLSVEKILISCEP